MRVRLNIFLKLTHVLSFTRMRFDYVAIPLNCYLLSRYFALLMMLLRCLTVLACLRTSSPYIEFYEELLTSDLGVIGVDEDKQGGDQVEVHYLEAGGDQSKPGIVRIDLETIYKLDSQLVRDQVRELFSRTFGGSKLPDVIISTLTTLMGPGVGVNNTRSAGFCLKINSRVENNLLNKKVERAF